VYDGLMQTQDNGMTSLHQASFSEQEVARVRLDPSIKFKPSRAIFGGSFWDTLKSIWKPINEVLKSTKIASSVASHFDKDAGDFLKKQGYGVRAGIVAAGCDNCPVTTAAGYRRRQ
jgi:hypothetical protein